MPSFFEAIYSELKQDDIELGEYLLIFPNKRAVTGFKTFLSSAIDSPVLWLPECMTFQEVLDKLLPYKKVTYLDRIFSMRKAVKEVYGNKALATISDEFLENIWNEFELIKREMLDPEKVFEQVKQIREIEQWDISSERSEYDLKSSIWWQKMPQLFQLYHSTLGREQLYTQTDALIHLIKNKEGSSWLNGYQKIVLAGFSNFNKIEQAFLSAINADISVTTIWDTGIFYLENNKNCAGRFINKQQLKFKLPILNVDDSVQNREWEQVNVVSDVEQLVTVFNLIRNLRQKGMKMGVVFCDQKLIPFALSHLPKDLSDVNIGDGIPLKYTEVFSLLELLASENRELKLPEIEDRLNELSLYPFFEQELLVKLPFLDFLLAFAHMVKKGIIDKKVDTHFKDQLNYESAVSIYNEIEHFVQSTDYIKEIDEYRLRYAFFKDVSNRTITIKGDRSSDVQFLGLLETRCLDFDTMIFLNFNDGVVPGKLDVNSILPNEIRKMHHLPGLDDMEGIIAYNFYRSIKRAKRVVFMVLNTTGSDGGDEPSRFIKQLQIEYNVKSLPLKGVDYPRQNVMQVPTQITNTLFSRGRLDQYLTQKGCSPSALATLIRNPMDFYLNYVVKLQEINKDSVEIEHADLGSVLHNSLEELYLPFVGEVLTQEELRKRIIAIPKIVDRQLKNQLEGSRISSGNYLLLRQIVVKWVTSMLKFDIKRIEQGKKIELLGLEVKVERVLKSGSTAIKLAGIVDRIERENEIFRIIDYKSGIVQPYDLIVKSSADLVADAKFSKAMQLAIYSYMCLSDTMNNVTASIISFRKPTIHLMDLKIGRQNQIDKEMLSGLMEGIDTLLNDVTQQDFVYANKYLVDSSYLEFN